MARSLQLIYFGHHFGRHLIKKKYTSSSTLKRLADHFRSHELAYPKADTSRGLAELFPIWNLPLRHPVNLAYEAATADIGDFNAIDNFHKEVFPISPIRQISC